MRVYTQKPQYWTVDDVTILLKMWDDGKHVEEIALALGRRKETVYIKANRVLRERGDRTRRNMPRKPYVRTCPTIAELNKKRERSKYACKIPDKTERKCLGCGKNFMSEGKYNWQCANCKGRHEQPFAP